MKLLANENIPLASVQYLIAEGLDIKSVGKEFKGISDREVIQLAIEEERTIITFDRDYGDLIFRHGCKPPCGVIYLRWNTFNPDDPGKYIASVITKSQIDFSYALTVIDEDSIRQRRYQS